MSELTTASCPICGSEEVEKILELESVPVLCNVLYSSAEEARNVPRGQISLYRCLQCGHGWNPAFDSNLVDYDAPYENSLHFSGTFERYAKDLATDLIRRYGLRGRRILEVGCGRGDFLRFICQLAEAEGIGYDPSLTTVERTAKPRVSLYPGVLRPGVITEPVDFVICRHVLEHLERPGELLVDLYAIPKGRNGTTGYFEVPSFDWMVESVAVWDVIYEHVHYFSRRSLVTLFLRSGYEVLRSKSGYGGQYLSLEVRSGNGGAVRGSDTAECQDNNLTQDFCTRAERKLRRWRRFILDQLRVGKKVAVWGIGSKAITFLNVLGLGRRSLWLVDQNPRKQGRFAAGTELLIHSPNSLRSYQPDVILLPNRFYLNEVTKRVEELGLRAQLVSVH